MTRNPDINRLNAVEAIDFKMPTTDDLATFRQYTRCYIMLLIDGYLITDKSNNQVHIRWLPLLAYFGRCSSLSFRWGSAVLT
ncbi:hypothetical protein Ahy_A10g050649 [Arachis hypogaea]|uniref:Aminotransferase-like plant mobile domain-containing protein n=1 Tax=Arachis hypogaea TaxID=3818 RepID=A0A445BA02_ARAHY|nr:hypothetical protein Ahy_A10g050649 [Arachis hypogaea]